jgi:hypothetical protein
MTASVKSLDIQVREGKPTHIIVVLYANDLSFSFESLREWAKNLAEKTIQSTKYTMHITLEYTSEETHIHSVCEFQFDGKKPE